MSEQILVSSGLIHSLRLLLVILAGIAALFLGRMAPSLGEQILTRTASGKVVDLYQRLVLPRSALIGGVLTLLAADIVLVLIDTDRWLNSVELLISLTLSAAIVWLGVQFITDFFDNYLLELTFANSQKVSSEFFVVGKFLANFSLIVLIVIIFAQTHQFNIFGLLASLGIGGLAIAFAAQKTLEQFLGGIVLYIDRPFIIDDYIGLPDGTFGRVESIGLRSTRVRTSGKGTLVIVPNNVLTQMTVENYTGVKKVISIFSLSFHRFIPVEEQALIRQVILASTKDILGIDTQSTNITFRDLPSQDKTQAQITFFVLGTGEVSMDLRQQLLDIANQNINKQLKEYGIAFSIEKQAINVDLPLTI